MQLGRRNLVLGLGFALGTAALTRGLVACRREGTDPPDRSRILTDLTAGVIIPAYSDAATDTAQLATATSALRDAPNADSLAAARAAWRKARATWKFTDGFLFGPADELAITGGAIDTLGDVTKIEAIAADTATTPLDATTLGKLGANERGFGGLEVLLFDPARDDATMLATFGAGGSRRSMLAVLVATELASKVAAVRDAWLPGAVGYGDQLAKAGRGSTVYPSEQEGVAVVVNALVSAAEILITLRLAKPLGVDVTPNVPKPALIESPRADASIDDIAAALGGLEAVYLGRRGALQGLALSDAVADRNAAADAHLKDTITKAKAAVAAIPGPLRTALVERRAPVLAAYAACKAVKTSLETEAVGALGTSLGFTVTDGD